MRTVAERIKANVQKVVVGKDQAIDLALVALLCRGHALIEDVPGIGKTTMAKALSASLDCEFRRIQFTPDLMPGDVLGGNVLNMQAGGFDFRPGPIFAQVLLADEINRATPRTQTALLEAMQERQVTIDGETRSLPDPFIVLATLNPIEMEGTFPLPEAQLDRFMLRISLGYPTQSEESEILLRFNNPMIEPVIDAVMHIDDLNAAQHLVTEVRVDDTLRTYLLQVVDATRNTEELQLGASPRAAISLYRASQAWAAIAGRQYVVPDDIKAMIPPVLSHRLIPSSQARLRGRGADAILQDCMRGVPVPIER
ncbi:MAG: MoxR family ATPase [Chloroflexi bacterium]|nr:MoxR family ATPase [Chloroflexota bacterium]